MSGSSSQEQIDPPRMSIVYDACLASCFTNTDDKNAQHACRPKKYIFKKKLKENINYKKKLEDP